jgi:hypothetical protein
VQEPPDNGVETGVVELIDVGLLEVIVAALPADEVPEDHKGEDAEGGGAAPVDGGVAEEEILYD